MEGRQQGRLPALDDGRMHGWRRRKREAALEHLHTGQPRTSQMSKRLPVYGKEPRHSTPLRPSRAPEWSVPPPPPPATGRHTTVLDWLGTSTPSPRSICDIGDTGGRGTEIFGKQVVIYRFMPCSNTFPRHAACPKWSVRLATMCRIRQLRYAPAIHRITVDTNRNQPGEVSSILE